MRTWFEAWGAALLVRDRPVHRAPVTEVRPSLGSLPPQDAAQPVHDLVQRRPELLALTPGHHRLPAVDELRAQAEAVKSERRLLDASDPVPDIRKTAVGALSCAGTSYTRPSARGAGS